MTTVVRARAKINLALDVGPLRADSFHGIRTVLQTISLADRLAFTRAEPSGVRITCDEQMVPTGENNLVARAAEAFADCANVDFGLNVHITKRIPIEAGLGGGSSDAAATLLALNRLSVNPLSTDELVAIAGEIGSDVAFFLIGGAAYATGRGEQVTALPDLPPMPIVLVRGDHGSPTAAAYELLDRCEGRETGNSADRLAETITIGITAAEELAPLLGNDFDRPLSATHPEIERITARLLELGALRAMLCGSGSAVFGLYTSSHNARRAAHELQAEGFWATFAFTVPRSYSSPGGGDG